MRRNRAFNYGGAFPVLVAGLIGYLIGGWHPGTVRASDGPSAAESVELRFPQAWNTVPPAAGIRDASQRESAAENDVTLALLSPEPMVAQPDSQAVAQVGQESLAGARVATAVAEEPVTPAAPGAYKAAESMRPAAIAVPRLRSAKAPTAAVRRRVMNRPGYMLDDAQIASIKERLHLTPDQEQMWPAVEVALRNITYIRAQAARGPNVSRGGADLAEVDPESVEGLKSAAIPLIMSFNDEQKQEVRDVAHVMGLNELASQF